MVKTTSELVQRLRDRTWLAENAIDDEAADRIEALEALRDQMITALQVGHGPIEAEYEVVGCMQCFALAAAEADKEAKK